MCADAYFYEEVDPDMGETSASSSADGMCPAWQVSPKRLQKCLQQNNTDKLR